jgi:hypothetical protein
MDTMSPLMATREHDSDLWISESRRLVGVAFLAISIGGWVAWSGWRLASLDLHPIRVAAFLLEIAGALTGVAVAVGLLAADSPRAEHGAGSEPSYRFALAVAAIVGRTRSIDLHSDVRWLARNFRDDRHRSPADIAIAAVLVDGPRRLATVAVVTIALLIGAAPIPVPPAWVALSGVVAVAGMAVALVVLADGRILLGDRTRWSFAAVGEIFARQDRDDFAPRRWVGAVATVVVVSLAVALRGISDRWTHGLNPMADGDRMAVMVYGFLVVIGALYTLRTTPTPQQRNAHLVSRRHEERTARHSAIGGALIFGVVGLVAGILPGGVDAADDDSGRIEHSPELDGRPTGATDGG